MYERTIKLIGEDNLNKIKNTTVLLVGVGGVGGFALEGLVRSGVGKIIIIDYDNVDASNLNRQIITNINNIGKLKVDVAEEHAQNINKNIEIIKINKKLDKENAKDIFNYKFDYVIDACDTIPVKCELIKLSLEKNITIVSSMGTGNKLDPSMLQVMDVRKTSYDPIAKKIRKYLKDNHINKKVMVVCSCEQGNHFEGSIPSMMFTPAYSGILCSNYIIREIIKSN